MTDIKIVELKKSINQLVMEYAPEKLTLKDAEAIACDILVMIMNGCDVHGIQVERVVRGNKPPERDAI